MVAFQLEHMAYRTVYLVAWWVVGERVVHLRLEDLGKRKLALPFKSIGGLDAYSTRGGRDRRLPLPPTHLSSRFTLHTSHYQLPDRDSRRPCRCLCLVYSFLALQINHDLLDFRR
jgi:hypothetical protein